MGVGSGLDDVAAEGEAGYSVRLIDGTDNGKAGLLIQKMYEENRDIDNDPLYVKITP